MALSTISGTTGITDATITSVKLADFAAAVDLNGVELILDADQDTSITADTDDRIDFKIAGVEHISISNSSGDTVIKPMVDAKDIVFQQYDGNKIFEINDGNFVAVSGAAAGPGEIRIYEDTDLGTNYSGFKVGNLTASVAYVLPLADGTDGFQLTTDGSGTLSWASAGTSLANDGNNRVVTGTGSGLNGEANLTFDGSTLAVTGAITGSTDLTLQDDLILDSDAAVISFGEDNEITVTHVADTGLLLNGASVMQFRDSAINIGSPADGDLDINADDEIELNSTLIDINGNVEISGTAVTTGVHTFTAVPVFPNNTVELADIQADAVDGTKIADNAIDSEHYTDGSIDTAHLADGQITTAKLATAVFTGATDIGAAIADADLFLMDDGAGGTIRKTAASRIKTYAGTSGAVTAITSVLNTSLVLGRDADNDIDFTADNIITLRAAGVDQVKLIDNVFSPVADSDVDLGTSSLYFKDAYIDTITTTGTITTAGELDAATLDISGAIDIAGASQFSSTITVGVDDTGYDVKFFGATASSHMLWDESADTLNLVASTLGVGAVGTKDLGTGIHIKTSDNSGGSVNAAADELVIESNGHTGMTIASGSSSTGTIAFGDQANNSVGKIEYDHSTNYLRFIAGDTEKVRYTSGAVVFNENSDSSTFRVETDDIDHMLYVLANKVGINEVAPEPVLGLTINSAAEDGGLISLKSSDVAHGMTGLFETDTYGSIGKQDPTGGALNITGLGEGTLALRLLGVSTGVSTNHSTGAEAPINLDARIKSGTGQAAVSADANLLRVTNAGANRFIIDEDGDIFHDGSASAFDTYDDAHLIRAHDLATSSPSSIIQSKFDDFLKYKKADLKKAGILDNLTEEQEAEGQVPFVNLMKLQKLHNGAIWQQYEKTEKLTHAMYELAKEAIGKRKADAILDKHEVKLLN